MRHFFSRNQMTNKFTTINCLKLIFIDFLYYRKNIRPYNSMAMSMWSSSCYGIWFPYARQQLEYEFSGWISF